MVNLFSQLSLPSQGTSTLSSDVVLEAFPKIDLIWSKIKEAKSVYDELLERIVEMESALKQPIDGKENEGHSEKNETHFTTTTKTEETSINTLTVKKRKPQTDSSSNSLANSSSQSASSLTETAKKQKT